MMMEAEVGVMLLQAKEGLGLTATDQKPERGKEVFFPTGFRGICP